MCPPLSPPPHAAPSTEGRFSVGAHKDTHTSRTLHLSPGLQSPPHPCQLHPKQVPSPAELSPHLCRAVTLESHWRAVEGAGEAVPVRSALSRVPYKSPRYCHQAGGNPARGAWSRRPEVSPGGAGAPAFLPRPPSSSTRQPHLGLTQGSPRAV